MAFEYLIQRFLVQGPLTINNGSAVVTGVLLAFNLPATIPWWIVVIGAFVAIAVAKMTFGGLGKNPFNPALVGRVFLLGAYPVQMTTWPLPVNGAFDALSGATPLAAVKHGAAGPDVLGVQEMLLGNMPGSLGEVAALALLVGFAYLFWRRVITWHIPVTVLATIAVFAFIVALCAERFRSAAGSCPCSMSLPVVPSSVRSSWHRLLDLADDRPGRRDLRHRNRRHHDAHPSVGLIPRVCRSPS